VAIETEEVAAAAAAASIVMGAAAIEHTAAAVRAKAACWEVHSAAERRLPHA
jgi:hypothetical protein